MLIDGLLPSLPQLASISKCATKPELLAVAYRNLRIAQIYFCSMNLLDFDDAAAATSCGLITYSLGTGNLFFNQNLTLPGYGTGSQFANIDNDNSLYTLPPVLTATDFEIVA